MYLYDVIRSAEEIREMVLSYVADDPLYQVLKDTPQEEILFSDEYLGHIIEKKGYPMLEIAEWFNTSDGQLRYYLRPFESYIFEEDGVVKGNTNNVIRLNIRSILKLRMLILLKEEYRVKGLKQLLGIDGEGYITQVTPAKTREVAFPNQSSEYELEEIKDKMDEMQVQLETFNKIITGIMKTGIFRLSEGSGNNEIILDDKRFEDKLNQIIEGSEKGLVLVENVEMIEREKQYLIEKEKDLENRVDEIKKDIERKTQQELSKIQDKKKEMELNRQLRLEAMMKWKEQNKYGKWAKIFKSDQIEIERLNFINNYVETNLKERLKSDNQIDE